MGNISPSKMPKGTKTARRDDTDFTKYAKGGKVKKMNEGGESAAEKVKAKEKADAEKQALKQNIEPRVNRLPISVEGLGGRDKKGTGFGGKATFAQPLTNNSDLQASIEGGGYKPDDGKYMGQAKAGLQYNLRFKDGGKTKSKVNEAGNYTKPSLRKKIVAQVKAAATQGTGAGQWSARKAQLVAKKYKASGGGYKD